MSAPGWMIVGLALLSILLLGALLSISAIRGYGTAIADAERIGGNQALALELHAARTIDSIDSTIGLIIEAMAQGDVRTPAFRARLQQIASSHPQIGRIGIVDADGRLVQSSFDPPADPVDYSDREFFAIHRDHAEVGLFISRPVLGRAVSTWTIPVSRRISDRDGRFAGIVVVALDPAYLNSFLQAIDLGPNSDLTIFRADGTLVAHAPGGGDWMGKTATSGPLFDGAQAPASSGTFRGTLLDDRTERIVSYRRSEEFPLLSVVGIATDDALAGWYGFLREAAAVWIGATLLVGMFAFLALAALRRRAMVEGKFRDLLESAPDGMVIIDSRGRIHLVNAETERLFGYAREELLNQPVEILMPERHRDRHRARVAAYIEHPQRRPMSAGLDLWGRRKDGSEFPVEISLSPLQTDHGVLVSSAIRDISAHVQIEAEMRDTNQRLETLIDATPLALIELDRDARVRSWNPAAEKIFGWRADEVLGKPLPTVPDDLRDEMRIALDACFSGWRMNETETRRLRKDGSAIDVTIWRAPHRNARGVIVGSIAILADITEKKQAEDQLRQSHRLQAIGQLTGGVAHEFNNLLQVILGNLEVLGDSVRGLHDASEMVERIMRAARRGADLTQNLLAFSRRQPLRPQIFSPKDEIRGLENLLRATIGANYSIHVDVPPDVPQMLADTTQLSNAILNLVINARDAMPAGGDISVRVRDRDQDRVAAKRLDLAPGRYVSIDVTDSGVGMEPDVAARAIEPFFTTKEVGRGTGLGLSMVHGFIRQSGGAMEIITQPGKGTTVRLLLPAAAERADRPVEATRLRLVQTRNATILVVEDEPDVLATAAALLRNLGYRVIVAEDGPAALAALKAAGRVDILFTDIVMPKGMSGFKLAHEARAYQADLKVVYTSGYNENAVVDDDMHGDGLMLLRKPYTKDELAAAMERVLANGHLLGARRKT